MAEKTATINCKSARAGEISSSLKNNSKHSSKNTFINRKGKIMTTNFQIKVARIKKVASNNHLKAFADISLNDCITIRNLKVVEGEKGLFVSMPQELSKTTNKWYDLVRCQNKEIREEITDKVLAAYKSE